MSEIFIDTMNGLLEAIAIKKGEINLSIVPNMPGETLRDSSFVKGNIDSEPQQTK